MSERFVGAGQQFQTILDAILHSANGDVITITDSAVYEEAFNDLLLNDITIRSCIADPDDFPVLKLYLNSNTLNHINHWVFKAVIMEPNSDSRLTFNLKNITFRRCVFRNYDYLLASDSQIGSAKVFESCLFYNISDFVFNARQNFSDGALAVRNCTFHNCANIFKNDFYNAENAASPKFNNCVFTASPDIASQVEDGAQQPGYKRQRLFLQFKYCTFSNDPQTINARIGENSLVNVNEALIYAQSAREKPSHFKINDDPAVRDSGSDTLGYSPDISGADRTPPYDRGAWEYDGEPPPPTTKFILPYINYQGAF